MAQKVQTLYVDDLDGSEADGTIRFGLDGTEYEIDLNANHAQELRDVLARYLAAGRRVRASTSQSSRSAWACSAFRSISYSVPSRPKRIVPSASLPSRSSMNRVCIFWATGSPFSHEPHHQPRPAEHRKRQLLR